MKELVLIFHILAVLLLYVDWMQTRHIAKNPHKFYEKWNWVLGRHPKVAHVNLYFGAWMVGFVAFQALAHSEQWRYAALAVSFVLIVIEAAAVINNRRIGIKMEPL